MTEDDTFIALKKPAFEQMMAIVVNETSKRNTTMWSSSKLDYILRQHNWYTDEYLAALAAYLERTT